MMTGSLYLVPTPIGNLEDMTMRAVSVLRDVDIVACEDTRRSGQLLAHFGLDKKKISYFEHNEIRRIPQIIGYLNKGQSVAVISDGGSPGLSDPAFRLVQAAIEAEIQVIPLPGANAVVPALIASGMPTDHFFFEGFLPVKSGKRKRRLEELRDFPHTVIVYESVHRVVKTLQSIEEILGDRPLCLAREISKIHEEFIRGSASDIMKSLTREKTRGEFVIVIAGSAKVKKRKEKRDF